MLPHVAAMPHSMRPDRNPIMRDYSIVFFMAAIAAASFGYGMVKPEIARVAKPIMFVFIALTAGSYVLG
jgi:uncharacterized membrane protein YtjA (UPF0391 family)